MKTRWTAVWGDDNRRTAMMWLALWVAVAVGMPWPTEAQEGGRRGRSGPTASSGGAGSASAGQSLFNQRCASCHSTASLARSFNRIVPNLGSINSEMRGIALTVSQIADLQAYLASPSGGRGGATPPPTPAPAPAPGGGASAGQTLFAQRCSGCHTASVLAPFASRVTPNLGSINTAMSGITLTTQQVSDMQAYLASVSGGTGGGTNAPPSPVPGAGGSASAGQLFFGQTCSGCHSAAPIAPFAGMIVANMGSVNAAMSGVTLTPQQIADLQAYLATLGGGGVTGGTNVPPGAVLSRLVVFGCNNLGMHCMDSDFSVFCTLPPYNTVVSQVKDRVLGTLLTGSAAGVTYQGVTDAAGSINTTSEGKNNFWTYSAALFGVALPADMGLPVPGPGGFAMPGLGNTPQDMGYEPAYQWYVAYGIPLTPYDNAGSRNLYPIMRLSAQVGTNVATADVVLPVSDEMNCAACHASGAGPAAQPTDGWAFATDPLRDYRLNILRLHDELNQANAVYRSALTTGGYQPDGLYATVLTGGKPILCARCHLSEALPGSGLSGVPALTAVIHGRHANVVDPVNNMTLDAEVNRSSCYNCHPGSVTRCLRGAMGKAVKQDGSLEMHCQACHGSMSTVAQAGRTGWLDEPNCQACHSGTATHNNGQIRYTSVFQSGSKMRTPVDQIFATTPNAPVAGVSLFRFSRGHGGLYCEMCHGSTHAEFPTLQDNDNVYSVERQGHAGMLSECSACHATVPNTVNGGPHGLHPLGQAWVSRHSESMGGGGLPQCQTCHGGDYCGTVLSRAQADRSLTANGAKTFWRGYQIGCFSCHNGPGGEGSAGTPPTVKSLTMSTTTTAAQPITLTATDPANNPLTLRIVSQPMHGRVGLSGTVATYYPDGNYAGADTFTYSAWNGKLDSNLGTVTVNVTGAVTGLVSIWPVSEKIAGFRHAGVIRVTASPARGWKTSSDAAWLKPVGNRKGSGNGTVRYLADANGSGKERVAHLSIGGQTSVVTQASTEAGLTGEWGKVAPSKTGNGLAGDLVLRNPGKQATPWTRVVFYVSDNPKLDRGDLQVGKAVVSEIGPGQTRTRPVKVDLPVATSASGKYLIALLDPDDTLPDSGEEDHTVRLGPLP